MPIAEMKKKRGYPFGRNYNIPYGAYAKNDEEYQTQQNNKQWFDHLHK
jgi:hypothetical protein